jgi:CO dehydrogenase/acetyl-CoA synthase gamma subunit (corrinoid Fe-S protein)
MAKKWSDMPELPVFFDRYIKKVDNIAINAAFEKHSPSAIMADMDKLALLKDQVYAPGKWTVKDILQHIIDTERILAYRALRFARNDKTALNGFEENDFALNTTANKRTVDDLMSEWQTVRKTSKALFQSFDEEMLQRNGLASNNEISVLALGYVIIGHPIHHYQVLEERYFPLLD